MADVVQTSFEAPSVTAEGCTLSIKLPKFSFGFLLPKINFPPAIPIPFFGFALSCDPANPIKMNAGISYGGNRSVIFDADPDKDGDANT